MTRQTLIRQVIGWLLIQVALLIGWWDNLPTVRDHPWWLAAMVATEIVMVAALIDLIRRTRTPASSDAHPHGGPDVMTVSQSPRHSR